MKRALQRYGIHFAAIVFVIVLGLGGAGYILGNQRFYLPHWVPIIGSDFDDYTVDFNSAKAVVPGQGQTVTIAGVTVGEIGDVKLVNGRGRVTIKIRSKYANRIHTDASASLRPRTPLEDMIVYLDPGTKTAPILKPGGNIPASRTMTPTEFDQILSTFDPDTRAYLAILLQQGSIGLDGQGGSDLGKVLKGLEPATTYSARIAKALKSRNAEAARAVTSLKTVADALGKNTDALGAFIRNSATTFQAVGDTQNDLSGVVKKSPEALESTRTLLKTTGDLSEKLGKATKILERPTEHLDAGLAQLTKFASAATPVLKNDLRPFAREVQAPLKKLQPAVQNLQDSSKNVATGTTTLRQLFDGLAYKPTATDDLSPLTLAGWIGHAGLSLTSNQDAAGAVGRTVLYADCGLVNQVKQVRGQSPVARVITDLLGTPNETTRLPNGQLAGLSCN
ncbi:MAG: MlaD family protein [Patulibacter sp.]|nr:MlaD family protein [Patulibacter sp.]